MLMNHTEAIAILNQLVTTCKDGANGYRVAETDVETPELKLLFDTYTKQRAEFVAELLAEIHRLDTAADREGSSAAQFHRRWMNLKAAMPHRDATTVLVERARGECAALKDYEAALHKPLPPETRALLEKQYAQVREAHACVDGLKVIGVLNTLIVTCKDGEKGYLAAREHVRAGDLKEQLDAYARQRAQFAAELQAEVHRLGDTAVKRGSWTGLLHRGWMGVKSAVRPPEARRVLDECLRGEDAALKCYAAAVEEPLPPELKALIVKQFAMIQEAHDHLAMFAGMPVRVAPGAAPKPAPPPLSGGRS